MLSSNFTTEPAKTNEINKYSFSLSHAECCLAFVGYIPDMENDSQFRRTQRILRWRWNRWRHYPGIGERTFRSHRSGKHEIPAAEPLQRPVHPFQSSRGFGRKRKFRGSTRKLLSASQWFARDHYQQIPSTGFGDTFVNEEAEPNPGSVVHLRSGKRHLYIVWGCCGQTAGIPRTDEIHIVLLERDLQWKQF